ncbi:hypothetical protein [Roseobacter ponti]|uniref:Uncharacterized protein n=1 Tax=Roseobacter ponti TaxID=1891787 RepID=A0A858STX1_9RHOB|nr:hypothetical protein [Roseobacter ponti]QJF51418.1 hypothetical protein G3256_09710 [Roseobacter ponti]
MSTLDARLLAAHEAGDQTALVTLYTEAADQAADDDAAGFYLTQAYIYGLELGHGAAGALRARLVSMGRETPAPQSPES